MAVPANAQAIFNGLVKAGLTPVAACGVLGNIQNESGGDLNSVGSGGCGLIGYTPCSSAPPGGQNGQPVALQAAAAATYVQNSYPGGITALNKITDPNQAGQSFAQLGERCLQCGSTPGASTAQLAPRGQNAVDCYNAYKAGTLGNPTQGTAPATGSAGAAAAASAPCPKNQVQCCSSNGINLDALSSTPVVGGLFPKTNLFNGCQLKALTAGLLIGGGGFVMLAGVVLVAAYGLGHTGAGRAITAASAPIPGVGRATGTAARASRGQVRRPQSRPQPAKRPAVRVPANQRNKSAGAAGASAGGRGVKQGVDTYDKGYSDGVNSVSGIDQSKRVRAADITSQGGNRTAKGSTSAGTKRRETPRKAA